jgi:transposase
VPTTVKGYQKLLHWAEGFGPVCCAGVEGTGSYGAGLARYLKAAGISDWQHRVEQLEKDRDALLESMADAVPDALHDLTGVERNHVYRLLRLQVTPTAEGYEVSGALTGILHKGIDTLASVPKCKTGELSFHAWLSQGDERLELTRA